MRKVRTEGKEDPGKDEGMRSREEKAKIWDDDDGGCITYLMAPESDDVILPVPSAENRNKYERGQYHYIPAVMGIGSGIAFYFGTGGGRRGALFGAVIGSCVWSALVWCSRGGGGGGNNGNAANNQLWYVSFYIKPHCNASEYTFNIHV
ncbi:hypothetical protein PRIPAC_93077 [Pristionchus pacificus]|uniref:Uncharacterized protein n=1 Tax=Pristionchus pacificus TaxID=54126 RepID=A0A2A6BQQ3_PRIPA|nr:hypothetical protein PRIPAC_93077 [Pristionchus pacificus]|eukprot:PDM68091.1 hypothetical protein PRIPAC_46135 [Pristionchus pacificus]